MRSKVTVAMAVFFIAGIYMTACSEPRHQNGEVTALVKDVYGPATQRKGDKGPEKKLNNGDLLTTLTTIKTGDSAAVLLLLAGNHVFRIGEKTTVVLSELGKDKSYSFKVLAGNIWSFVRKVNKPTKYEVETPSAVAGVSGTVFAVFHDSDSQETTVSTNNGQVDVRQGADSTPVPVTQGKMLRMSKGSRSGGLPKPEDQPPAHRRMWFMMRNQEGWMPRQGGGTAVLKLDKSAAIETHVRTRVFIRKGNGGKRGQGGGGARRPGGLGGGKRGGNGAEKGAEEKGRKP